MSCEKCKDKGHWFSAVVLARASKKHPASAEYNFCDCAIGVDKKQEFQNFFIIDTDMAFALPTAKLCDEFISIYYPRCVGKLFRDESICSLDRKSLIAIIGATLKHGRA